jgi:hypothetical protein
MCYHGWIIADDTEGINSASTISSGNIYIRSVDAGASGGVTGALTLSTGATTNGNSGALYFGYGEASKSRGGAVRLTVGSGHSGSGRLTDRELSDHPRSC